MKRQSMVMCCVAMTAMLAACGEKPQMLGSNPNDEQPWAGSKYPYAAPGWKAGDKQSWQEHLKVRTQRGQNEYSKM